MNTPKKKFVVLERLQGVNKGAKFWTMNTDNNVGIQEGEPLYKEVLKTNDSSEAIAECGRKTNNHE